MLSTPNRNEAKILVVDDSASDRALVGGLIKNMGWSVIWGEEGRHALKQIESETPSLVLTDLNMPELDGLQLVAEVRKSHPQIPVILMTGVGSEQIAAEALRMGAASYIPKQNLVGGLEEILDRTMATIREKQDKPLELLFRRQETHFEIDYDPQAISTLVNHIQQSLFQFKFCDEAELIRIGMSLSEAFNNAVEHGNLELDSCLREEADDAYLNARTSRIKQTPYRERTVQVSQKLTQDEVEFIVRDEGNGFDPSQLPDPTDPENLMKVYGRGILLIRTFMDDVRFNSVGNEITMVKRRQASKTNLECEVNA